MKKVSIITVCKNSEDTIEETILSVIGQKYSNIEYIIIDGGSTDGTLGIINSYKEKIKIIISEPDIGIYDAINKGIEYSSGDIVGILHSDDIFASNDVIVNIANYFISSNLDAIYGDLNYVLRNNLNKVIRKWKSEPYNRNKLLFGWMPPHPTVFIKKKVFDRYGLYDLSFGTAADYELLIRFLYRYNISCAYLPQVVTKMRIGGVSNASITNRFKAHVQDWKAWIKNDISNFPIWVTLKPIRKIHQYFF